MMAKRPINMRIVCVDPIRVCPDYEELQFGLQDKGRNLQAGEQLSRDEIVFIFSLTVQKHQDGSVNFTGAFAHGPRTKRFAYLTYMGFDREEWRIYRRLKVPLSGISCEQVEAAMTSGGALQARVSGLISGAVPLLDGGWQLMN